jgi:hypothetical protein
MSELVFLCAGISLVVLSVVLSPFKFGQGGFLQDASASDSSQDLEARLTALLQRWLKDEAAFTAGEITQTEWRQRQRYLTARYVDTSRRLDWLTASTKGPRQG